MTIGERIKKLRTDLGRSQGEFAEIIGVQPQMLSAWERDKAKPKHNSLLKIIEATGIDPREFFEGIEIIN